MNSFLDVFNTWKLEDGQTPEFPIDILGPGIKRDNIVLFTPYSGGIPEVKNEEKEGYVIIPMYESESDKQLELDAGTLLLDAAIRRGLCSHVESEEYGVFSNRLLTLLNQQMTPYRGGNTANKLRGTVTDVFVRERAKVRADVLSKVKIHTINDEVWYNLISNSSLKNDSPVRKDLVIGIDLTDCDSFIFLKVESFVGLTVLDSSSIILGRF